MKDKILKFEKNGSSLGSYNGDTHSISFCDKVGKWELRENGNAAVIDQDCYRFDLAERHGFNLVS